jgi:enolase
MKIKKIYAQEIYDSRGLPTIECLITLENLQVATASVPSGASVGHTEGIEKRDSDHNRLLGKGVLQATSYINNHIAPLFENQEINALAMDSQLMDLDHHPQKITIGANTILAVSIALFKAQAIAEGCELFQFLQSISRTQQVNIPQPMFNVINGGAHANNNLTIQEYMIVPRTRCYQTALEAGVTFYHHLKKILENKNISTAVGDEGGFAPHLESDQAALDLLMKTSDTIKNFSYDIALDIAASEFYDDTTNIYNLKTLKITTSDDMIKTYQRWCKQYPIISIEDGMAQNDIEGWKNLTSTLSNNIQLVGDDVFTTNPMLIRKGITQNIANSVLIKPNQIGSVSQTLAAIDVCKKYNRSIVVSHRSGETTDTFICDLAVGVSAQYIKAGAPCRGERICKYNRLLSIFRQLEQA